MVMPSNSVNSFDTSSSSLSFSVNQGMSLVYLFYKNSDKDYQAEKISLAYPGTQKANMLHDFIESILHKNKEPLVTEDEIFASMAICFAIEKSAKLNKPLMVEYL